MTYSSFSRFAVPSRVAACLPASRRLGVALLPLAIGLCSFGAQASAVQEASAALNLGELHALAFSGTGSWYQFGQAPSPGAAWPKFDLTRYEASLNFDAPGSHVQLQRKQLIEPDRQRPAPVEQRPDQYLAAGKAWNLAPAPAGSDKPVVTAQTASVEERSAEIWSTPQGFLLAALSHHASEKKSGKGVEVSFELADHHRYVGRINAQHQVESVRTWIDNPVLGDTEVETRFGDYRDFDGTQFPARVQRLQGGHPVLDLNVTAVHGNPTVDLLVPPELATAEQSGVQVNATEIAEGVYFLSGGTHHSVAIAQKDEVVVVEAPLNEARSLAVIDKVHALFPDKPIRHVINTHVHFDHAGGLRTYVAEGASVVTDRANVAWLRKVWATPHRLQPDAYAKAPKAAHFLPVDARLLLPDAQQPIEIHRISGNGHDDAFDLVYLPNAHVLIEADAFTPAATAARPATPNPYTINLVENIHRLGLDVAKVAPLHGPGVVSLADLQAAGQPLASAQ